MKIHKTHPRKRKTMCGIKYDNINDLPYFVNNNLKGHWKKINCFNCLKIGKGAFKMFGIVITRKLTFKERKEILSELEDLKLKDESRADYVLSRAIMKIFN